MMDEATFQLAVRLLKHNHPVTPAGRTDLRKHLIKASDFLMLYQRGLIERDLAGDRSAWQLTPTAKQHLRTQLDERTSSEHSL